MMKCGGDEASAVATAPVQLNVGGMHFDTTRETLGVSSYLKVRLAGEVAHDTDPNGRFFVDRDGKLFEQLLQFMRNRVRPSNKILAKYKDALVAECEYFGFDWMLADLRGEISPYDMRLEDQNIRLAEMNACNPRALLNIFTATVTLTPREHLEMPLFMSNTPQPNICSSYAHAHKRLDAFTGGLLDAFQNIPGLVIAGGAVLNALAGVESSDVDVFFTKDHDDSLRSAFAAMQRNHAAKTGPKTSLLVMRSNSAVTVFCASNISEISKNTPVQLITTKYNSADEILANFDVDSCCVAWTSCQFLCSARGLRALSYGVNVADNKRFDGPTYCRRLEKYARRGPRCIHEHVRTATSMYVCLLNCVRLAAIGNMCISAAQS